LYVILYLDDLPPPQIAKTVPNINLLRLKLYWNFLVSLSPHTCSVSLDPPGICWRPDRAVSSVWLCVVGQHKRIQDFGHSIYRASSNLAV